MIVNGKKLCYLIKDDEERYNEKQELEFVFCPLLPESELVAFMAIMEEQGYSFIKGWIDGL